MLIIRNGSVKDEMRLSKIRMSENGLQPSPNWSTQNRKKKLQTKRLNNRYYFVCFTSESFHNKRNEIKIEGIYRQAYFIQNIEFNVATMENSLRDWTFGRHGNVQHSNRVQAMALYKLHCKRMEINRWFVVCSTESK